MLLYDVTYPHSSDMDCKVGWSYLQRLAKDRKHEGAKAVCINGEASVLVLHNGEWSDESWRIEKRVANTDQWKVVGHAWSREKAIDAANAVIGGRSTGVRICRTDSPYATPEVVAGV